MNDPPRPLNLNTEDKYCVHTAQYIIGFETLFLINIYCISNRLGKVCSYIAAVITRAAELWQKTGQDPCTSRKCSWLPIASTKDKYTINITPDEIGVINFWNTCSRFKNISPLLRNVISFLLF